jgi:haloalkane dehalogenase
VSLIQTPPERFEDVPEYEFPYERVPVRDDGAAMAYVDVAQQGDDPPDETFLLLHGEPSWGFPYRKLVPTLPDHGRVVVPDMLGLG